MMPFLSARAIASASRSATSRGDLSARVWSAPARSVAATDTLAAMPGNADACASAQICVISLRRVGWDLGGVGAVGAVGATVATPCVDVFEEADMRAGEAAALDGVGGSSF